MELKLIEYAWNGANFVPSGTLTFTPGPQSIDKATKTEWRARHTGLGSVYPRCKYRYRRTVEFTLKGGCTGLKRRELEFYAMRQSKFKVENASFEDLISPEYHSDRSDFPNDNQWSPSENPQTLYVMFEESSYSIAEGKEDWYTYTIKLKVVNNEGIT